MWRHLSHTTFLVAEGNPRLRELKVKVAQGVEPHTEQVAEGNPRLRELKEVCGNEDIVCHFPSQKEIPD